MFIRGCRAGIEIWTPAKVNLSLEVLAKRVDGFHEIQTCLTTVGLFDTLCFRPRSVGGIQLQVRAVASFPTDVQIPATSNNLVIVALRRLQEATGTSGSAEIELVKRIPAAAGLGGGSSDAAAALLAANRGWKLGLRREELADIAAKVGSDVPSFLYQSPVLCRGRGELVSQATRTGRLELVIVRPDAGLATAEVYAHATVRERPSDAFVRESQVADGLSNGLIRNRFEVGRQMNNDLQVAAQSLSPAVCRVREAFQQLGLVAHQLSGSGTSYFGLCQNAASALAVASRLRALRIGSVYRVSTYHSSVPIGTQVDGVAVSA